VFDCTARWCTRTELWADLSFVVLPGVSHEFAASGGAVGVVGLLPSVTRFPRTSGKGNRVCDPPSQGMAIVNCTFKNNSAALTGQH
jgi:hypothetical protein